MEVVAGGVEDDSCFKRFANKDCETAQAWHIGRPMPARQLATVAKGEIRAAAGRLHRVAIR